MVFFWFLCEIYFIGSRGNYNGMLFDMNQGRIFVTPIYDDSSNRILWIANTVVEYNASAQNSGGYSVRSHSEAK